MQESYWLTTRSALSRPGDEGWEEVARCGPPLERLLRRRYHWLPVADRDDLVQDVLLEIKETLAGRHDPSRGRFRALLTSVVRRRVTDRLRADRTASLDPDAAARLAAPEPDEVDALDLEARLLEAAAACRDAFTQGPARDPDVLYALADRLVHGKTNEAIARAGGVGRDRVARLLARAGEAIFAHLLARELALALEDPRLVSAVTLFMASLRRPGDTATLLDELPDAALRAGLEEFLTRFCAALPRFQGDETAAGRELARGIELILATDREGGGAGEAE